VIPLLKIAEQARQACDVLVLAPDELVSLVSGFGFRVAGVGPVRPESGQLELQRYIAASEWVRVTSAFAACQERYFDRLNERMGRTFHRHRQQLAEYRPSCILCDEKWVPQEFMEFLVGLGIPIFFHSTAPNSRRHNAWSLKHCYWTSPRVAVHDAIAKTRNELRLWGKRLSSARGRVAAVAEIGRLPPIRPSKKAITRLSTGTSFLEKALLSHRLLYTGGGRLVLPTVPPLEAPLPHDLRQWLDQSPDGDIVYVSFGTLVRPEVGRIVNIARAVLACGKRVLLQYSGEFPAIPGVRQEQWVPQATVLSHPAIAMMISHGGAGSLDEALWHGKPMLCVPNVWDHYYNSWIVSLLGAGIALPRRALGSPRRLAAGVRRAMRQEHADSARAISTLMRNYWSANEEAVTNLFRSSAKTGTAARP
jgi:hypothetical protein